MHSADLKFDHAYAYYEEYGGDGDRHTLAARMEELLNEIEGKDQAAQAMSALGIY